MSVDADGHDPLGTKTAAEMFQLPETELVGLPAGRRRRPGDECAKLDGFERAGRSATRRSAADADGETFPAEVARTPFTFDGEPSHMVVVTDVTWRQEADAMRDRFIDVLSHELRTPVTSIYGGTQVLLSKGASLDDDDAATSCSPTSAAKPIDSSG